jgi:hypothetical protein
MMARRKYLGTYSVDVEIRDILDDLSDEDLIAYARERQVSIEVTTPEMAEDMLHDLRETFAAQDRQHFSILMMRLEDALGVSPVNKAIPSRPVGFGKGAH